MKGGEGKKRDKTDRRSLIWLVKRFMTVQMCWAERENLVKTGRGSHLVSCASDRGVLIDVVTCWGVSWGLRRERYFCSGWGSEAELSSGWWQLLTAFGSSPFFSTPGKVPPPRPLFPSFFWKSRPSSPTLVPPSDSVSHCLSPGARCVSPFQWLMFVLPEPCYIVRITI